MALNEKINHLTAAFRTETKRVPRAPDSNHAPADNPNRTFTVTQRTLSYADSPNLAHPSPKLASMNDREQSQQFPPLMTTQPEFSMFLTLWPLSSMNFECEPTLNDRCIDPQGFNTALKVGLVSDFVETGITKIISVRAANAYFARYRTELSVNFPVVVIGPAASATEVRSSKPVLFLAIIAAASGGDGDVGTRKRLQCLLTLVLTHCCSTNDEHNLEVVQASIVSALWYTPSDLIYGQEPMDMRQLGHAAANVATNIGLGKPSPTKARDPRASRYTQDSQNLKSSTTADLEARRTWLGCYFIGAK